MAAAFEFETAMSFPVEQWLWERGASCVAHEVDAGFGVPDLMAGVGTAGQLRNRRRQAQPVADAVQLRLLSFCGKWRTEDELRAWAPNGYAGLRRRAIGPLVEAGLLLSEQSRMRARRQPKDPFMELVAVELKLSDVLRGLRQAHSYRTLADVAYLALPAARVNAMALEGARRHFIGLLSVHPRAVEEVVQPPRASVAAAGRRRLASERVLVASLDSTRLAGSARR